MPDLTILQELLRKFTLALPNVAGAIAILLIGWIVSKMLTKTLRKILAKAGFDKLSDKLNSIDLVQRANLHFTPSAFIAKIVYYFLMLIFIVAATDVLGMPTFSNLVTNIINYIPQFVTAMVLLVAGLLLADAVRKTAKTACDSLGIPSASIISGFAFWFIFLTVGVSALAQAGLDTQFIMSNLTVLLGGGVLAFALGYGFASKNIVANFLASFYSKNKVKIGDIVMIDGIKGMVIFMDNSSLTLQSEGKKVVLPLSKLTSEKVEIFESQD